MLPSLFVSHSESDKDHARIRDLKQIIKSKAQPWMAENELLAGQDLANGIQKAVQKCFACVFLLTERSAQSKWCAAELGAFWGAGKTVVILTGSEDVKIDQIAPQLKGLVRTDSASEAWRALQVSNAGTLKKDRQVPEKHAASPEEVIVQRFRETLHPLESSISRIEERLLGLIPFEGDTSLFGMRYKHFFEEKRAIAACFMKDLEQRIGLSRGSAKRTRIRLIMDAGTTLFPVFPLLMRYKADREWTCRLDLITNNIPGIFVSLRDGRIEESDPYAPTAFKVHVVAGEPTPAFWALLPSNPKDELQRAQQCDDAATEQTLTIGVTTGNYAPDHGRGLFVRGPQHRAFKEALMNQADIIYSLLPLGKLLPRDADALNEHLVPKEFREDRDHCYTALGVPLHGKQEFVLITTMRAACDYMFAHWVHVDQQLGNLRNEAEQGRIGCRVRVLTVPERDFDMTKLSGGSEAKQTELEMPHAAHRDVLKKWFNWGKGRRE